MEALLTVLGPTSAGKTDLALYLAKKFNGELVSCDSRQVYKGLDIGTGKVPSSGRFKKGKGYWEMEKVKVWMLDVADPKKQYTVADYVKDAEKVIAKITKTGKLPIVVGGTGFYFKAFGEGLPSLGLPVNQDLRKRLERQSLPSLQTKLQKVSPDRWEEMNNSDRQNPRRLIRAIEIAVSRQKKGITDNSLPKMDLNILKIGLTAPREVLYKRIDERVIGRINQGMIKEVRKLREEGLTLERMKQLGLEYGVLADYLSGRIKTEDALVKTLQGKIHGFARRQLTWFRKQKCINWFDITDKNYPGNVEKLIAKWYHHPDAAKN